MPPKTHKRKKESRMHGKNMGTHGGGSRKSRKGSGHRGGKGMSGSGKRADHKKTLVQKLHGHGYFGKKGITSIGTKRDKRDRINLEQIQKQINQFKNEKGEIVLTTYKILGTGEVKVKLIIIAKEASKSAIEKVKKAGGEIILPVVKEKKVAVIQPKKVKKGEKGTLKSVPSSTKKKDTLKGTSKETEGSLSEEGKVQKEEKVEEVKEK